MKKEWRYLLYGILMTIISSGSFAQVQPEKMGPNLLPQKPGFRGGRGMMGPMPGHGHHLFNQLNLTPEQTARLQELRESYLRDTLVWRNELIVKRLDLRDLLRNPQAEPSQILSKQKEISQLEAKIQERTILYQLEIRKVLTPEQQKLLPPEFFLHPFPSPRMRQWRGGIGKE